MPLKPKQQSTTLFLVFSQTKKTLIKANKIHTYIVIQSHTHTAKYIHVHTYIHMHTLIKEKLCHLKLWMIYNKKHMETLYGKTFIKPVKINTPQFPHWVQSTKYLNTHTHTKKHEY